MTYNQKLELPSRHTNRISRKQWISATFFPMTFFVPITIIFFIIPYLSNPESGLRIDGFFIMFAMFAAFSIISMFNLKKQFRCKICNKPMRKRIHSLYCNSCRPHVTKMIQDWKGKIYCSLCEGKFNNYQTFLVHFRNIHNNSGKKPWIRYHPEDNAVRILV